MRKTKQKFSERLKDEFDFDVSAIGSYTDEQSEEIIETLIEGGKLASRINIMTGVKGSEKIKLLDMNIPLQSADACGKTPDGDIIFTDKTMTVVPVKIDMAVCNKTLKGTWAQMLLALGVRAEKESLPLEDIIAAYVVKTGQKKNQDLMIKGDVDSTNPDLVHYDGFNKLWKADVNITGPDYATATTVSNAFVRFCDLAKAIPTVLLDNGIVPEIICSRELAQMVLDNIYNDKDYNALTTKVSYDGGEISFVLPTTQITVRSYPQLSAGTGTFMDDDAPEIYAVPYMFMFFGTDQEGDMDDFWIKYEEIQEKLFFGVEWATGVQYVLPEYFKKITHTVS